ncbi:uncharacterized protein LOC141901742 [Tubulanus polymorphus]|uniref:uncharacterized protein LOC141901742 n=1 Tax=Tubulanus polymorphus TaxID=672921 RepID=UPI003DA46787
MQRKIITPALLLLGRVTTSRVVICNWSRITQYRLQHSKTNSPIKVLYDGGCPICLKEISVLKYLDKKKNNVEFVDITHEDYCASAHCGISRDEAMKQMTVINKFGQVETRVAAFRTMYAAVGLGWLLAVTRLPGISHLSEIAYDWFARNRLRLTGRQPECETGTCHSEKSDER